MNEISLILKLTSLTGRLRVALQRGLGAMHFGEGMTARVMLNAYALGGLRSYLRGWNPFILLFI